ncbi:DUF1793-domain-containing protein [Pluteus cervinus]|uniref:DUF1793-domain-containing protein n=1 Tax=Pluteus cervinus TaxID=181527 RepID=A0ACD3B292_9AGAR|nr:DUF1793-domain-containing protein [Pluteus cervinus]
MIFAFCWFTSCFWVVFFGVQDVLGQTSLPGAIPLISRSAYVNYWLDNSNPGKINWPLTWNNITVGWTGYARVDGATYQWLGLSGVPTNFLSRDLTPTRTIEVHQAGPVQLVVTYLSPLEPGSLVNQSIPLGYVAVEVSSSDGEPHSVQLYSDITGQFVSPDLTDVIKWDTTQTDTLLAHRIYLQDEALHDFPEELDMAIDGVVYYGMAKSPNVSWTVAADVDARGQFSENGKLSGNIDQTFRAISDHTPVFAVAVDLGSITQTQNPVAWTLGLVRQPVVRYSSDQIREERSPYYQSQYNNASQMVDAFANNYGSALASSIALDSNLTNAASSISPEYVDLVSLATRQAFGPVDITIKRNADSVWDTTNLLAFMKDIGSSRQISSVETIYAAFPAYLYFGSQFTGALLEPLMQTQIRYGTDPYALADLGPSYPNAYGGDIDNESVAVDNTAAMVLMNYAYASFSGNGTLILGYYNLLKQYSDYLVDHTYMPPGFIDGSIRFKPYNVNLALKGIIAIRSMAKISEAVQKADDASHYESMASGMATRWRNMSLSSDHLTSSYNESGSWGLVYNLYMDRLLGTKVVDDDIYAIQDTYYAKLAASAPPYGLPIDSNAPLLTKSHWTMFTAAACINNATRDLLINMVHTAAGFNANFTPLASTYNPTNLSQPITGQASPALGAVYAPLALLLTPQQIILPLNVSPIPIDKPPMPSPVSGVKYLSGGAIAGIIVGSVFGVIILIAMWWVWRYKAAMNQAAVQSTHNNAEPGPHHAPKMASARRSILHPSLQFEHFEPPNDTDATATDPFNDAEAVHAQPFAPTNPHRPQTPHALYSDSDLLPAGAGNAFYHEEASRLRKVPSRASGSIRGPTPATFS